MHVYRSVIENLQTLVLVERRDSKSMHAKQVYSIKQ